MTMQAWSHVPELTLGQPSVQVFRSLSDAGGEALSGAIAIPDLSPAGAHLFFGQVLVWANYDGGTTVGATATTGFSCSARTDYVNDPPVVAGSARQAMRWQSSGQTSAGSVYVHTAWGSSSRYGAQAVWDAAGSLIDTELQAMFQFNILDLSYNASGLTGTAKLDGLYVTLIPKLPAR